MSTSSSTVAHATRMHAHQHLCRPGLRPLALLHLQIGVWLCEDDSTHGTSIGSAHGRGPTTVSRARLGGDGYSPAPNAYHHRRLAVNDDAPFAPSYLAVTSRVRAESGWPPGGANTRRCSPPRGALAVGSPEQVAPDPLRARALRPPALPRADERRRGSPRRRHALNRALRHRVTGARDLRPRWGTTPCSTARLWGATRATRRSCGCAATTSTTTPPRGLPPDKRRPRPRACSRRSQRLSAARGQPPRQDEAVQRPLRGSFYLSRSPSARRRQGECHLWLWWDSRTTTGMSRSVLSW